MLERNGFLEECYFDWSYTPVRDERGEVAGVYNTCAETTPRVLGERRLALVRELSLLTSIDKQIDAILKTTQAVLGEAADDVPFGLVYAVDDDVARLVACAGLVRDARAAPLTIARDAVGAWPVFDVARTDEAVAVTDVVDRFGPVIASVWPEPVQRAMVLPLRDNMVLVTGMSPRLPDNDDYRTFLQFLGRQLAASLSIARAFGQEQQRNATLAELNRQKTAFFSNVSHEFRTPLTLMLGPIEDGLADVDVVLPPIHRERFELAQRNAHRLQKLVNTLLDFSQVEAGRARAVFAPTDIGRLTGELASTFRSAIERAGLTFTVEVSTTATAFLDPDLWEKVVLNLLSNALKFTFTGRISVEVKEAAEGLVVVIGDTGTGIAERELPRVFDRFHRIEGARSRSIEGSGIGLALVHDVVALHGGRIVVDSVVDRGTTFTITLPHGSEHLDPASIGSTSSWLPSSTTEHLVGEAMTWSSSATTVIARLDDASLPLEDGRSRARLLVADDNADMRGYLYRLLGDRWDVELVADGAAALIAARRQRPDLILSDVMMPGLDGFQLLKELRADELLREVPFILVSARDGEDARTAAIAAGADDYVVKPFTARELVSRVRARLDISRLRQTVAAERATLRDLFANAPAAICVLAGPTHVFELYNTPYEQLVGQRRLLGRPFREAVPELDAQDGADILDRVFQTGVPVALTASRVMIGVPEPRERFIDFVSQPRRNADGEVDGVVVFAFDVTRQIRAMQQLEHESRSKDEFLAMLGHELRNPLAPVVAAVHLARSSAELPADLIHHLDVIERQSHNLTRIVDDLLDVSRITRGLVTLHRDVVDLGSVVLAAVDVVGVLVEQKQHALSATVPADPLIVVGDAVRLEQIFVNLLTNAAKYTDDGGAISIALERQVREGEDVVVVAVTDNGVGIDAATLPHVFELFQQAERSLDRSLGGLGIGLTVVKRLVDLHGGQITATSAGPQKGSTFAVVLPLATAPPTARPPTTPPTAAVKTSTTSALSILVVDDNVDAAEALADLLLMWGHAPALAFDGATALQQIETFGVPDVVILDIGLPDIDGYEVARRLRAQPALVSTRIVALTGYGQAGDKARSAAAGFDEHLVKPVTPAALQALLRRV